jgi:hypothetical protein
MGTSSQARKEDAASGERCVRMNRNTVSEHARNESPGQGGGCGEWCVRMSWYTVSSQGSDEWAVE